MSVVSLPTCPDDCTGPLESVSFNECAPETHPGEIEWLYLWVDSATPPFASQANYDSAVHWATHLDETGTDIDDIRAIHVIGEQPEPEQTETTISGDRIVYGYKKFTLNLEVDETNETNYNFLLGSECNGSYKANYQTADGLLFGGWRGLDVSVKMNMVIPRRRQELIKYMVKVTWSSMNHPFRQISPVA